MQIETTEPDQLWRYYQRGYTCLVRSGRYFRQVLRPALSHVYFQRAIPLLVEYARATRNDADLSPSFGEQMEACPLTPRDLLHLDYAICLGYAEAQGTDMLVPANPLLDWPGPSGSHGVFIAVDAIVTPVVEELEEEFEEIPDDNDGEDDEGPETPFDL